MVAIALAFGSGDLGTGTQAYCYDEQNRLT